MSAQASDNLFVTGFPVGSHEEYIRTIFAQFGTVQSIKILHGGNDAGRGDLACLIRMGSADQAQWCVDNINGNIPHGATYPIGVRFSNKWGGSNIGGMGGGGPDLGLDGGGFTGGVATANLPPAIDPLDPMSALDPEQLGGAARQTILISGFPQEASVACVMNLCRWFPGFAGAHALTGASPQLYVRFCDDAHASAGAQAINGRPFNPKTMQFPLRAVMADQELTVQGNPFTASAPSGQVPAMPQPMAGGMPGMLSLEADKLHELQAQTGVLDQSTIDTVVVFNYDAKGFTEEGLKSHFSQLAGFVSGSVGPGTGGMYGGVSQGLFLKFQTPQHAQAALGSDIAKLAGAELAKPGEYYPVQDF